MPTLVTAAFNSAVPKDAPGEIVYLPIGSHKIHATVRDKPGEVTVNIPAEKGEAIAAALNAALQKRISSTVRPRLAFDHARTGPASGHPQSFRFDPEKGIMLAAGWSRAGRAAIEGEDFSYFSPTFLIDDGGFPSGLPDKGEIGSLVDEPAFRTIGRIAAADTSHQTNTNNTMSKLIFAALAISAAAENAETEAVQAIDRLKSENVTVKASLAQAEKELDALKTKIEAAEAAEKKALAERADTLVKAAVTDGRILPKDEEKQTKFRERISAGDTFAEEMLSQLPNLNGGLDKTIIKANSQASSGAESEFETKAHALIKAGEASDFDAAIVMVAAANPELYNDYIAAL